MKKIENIEENYVIDNEQLAKNELMRHFDGISIITEELIDEEVANSVVLFNREKKLINSISNFLDLLSKENSQFNIIKLTTKQIENINEFINNNSNYKYISLLFNMVTSLTLIRTKIGNNIVDFTSEIDKIYNINSKIINSNRIAPYLYYITNIQNKFYKIISNQIKLEGEDNPNTLIELLDDSYALKVSKIAVSLCYGDKEYDKNLPEEILENVILNYNAQEPINYQLASFTKDKYYDTYGTKEQKEKREIINENHYKEISIHEYYGQQMNILELINSKDEKYNIFLILKYGLGADQYFYSLDSIQFKTGISLEKLKNYYADSLKFIKNYQENLVKSGKVL